MSLNTIASAIITMSFIAAASVFTSTMDKKDSEVSNKVYCESVELFKDSKGESGHPDYNNNYYEVCE